RCSDGRPLLSRDRGGLLLADLAARQALRAAVGGSHPSALHRWRRRVLRLDGVPGACAAQAGALPMTTIGILQLVLYVVVLLALAKPLGAYMARVYEGRPIGLDRVLGWLERFIYRLCGVRSGEEMGWKAYAVAMLLFNFLGFLAVYVLQRVQGVLPLNPQSLGAVSPDSSFNTAVRFATNATVVQPTSYDEPVTDKDGKPVLDEKGQPKTKKSTLTEQVIAVGPAASQIAIKQLGTNGGGFFNVNSAHPFENPTPLSNVLELLAILLISAALCYTFGVMVGDTREGRAGLADMSGLFLGVLWVGEA